MYSLYRCASLADGALVFSSGEADVTIEGCEFRGLRSHGHGGVLKVSATFTNRVPSNRSPLHSALGPCIQHWAIMHPILS